MALKNHRLNGVLDQKSGRVKAWYGSHMNHCSSIRMVFAANSVILMVNKTVCGGDKKHSDACQPWSKSMWMWSIRSAKTITIYTLYNQELKKIINSNFGISHMATKKNSFCNTNVQTIYFEKRQLKLNSLLLRNVSSSFFWWFSN